MKATHTDAHPAGILRRGRAVAAAFLCAAILSVTVFGAVYYDSSKDPVVAYSAMEQYVGEKLSPLLSGLETLKARVTSLELNGPAPSGQGGTSSGVSGEAVQQILSRLAELEKTVSSLTAENKTLKSDLTSAQKELKDLKSAVDSVQTAVNSLKSELSSLSDEIGSVRTQLSTVKNNVSTLQKNFSQISDISTRLETVTYKVNNLTGDGGDIASLKDELTDLRASYNDLLDRMGQLYEVVFVPYHAEIYAKDAGDSLVLVLRSGTAQVISPYNTPDSYQGLNDLSDGVELYHGERLTRFHNILVPRGGDDGRGVLVTDPEGAYFMIGGDYTVVEP